MSFTRTGATDFSVFGDTDINGNMQVLDTKKSVENAFRMWLVSSRGEIPRAPQKGGYLAQWLQKPMTPENTEEIRAAILEGIENDFTPAIKVEQLSVEPDYQSRVWNIHLIGLVPEYKTRLDSSVRVRSAG